MATTVTDRMNLAFLDVMLGKVQPGKKATARNIAAGAAFDFTDSYSSAGAVFDFGGSYSSVSSGAAMRLAVRKMQASFTVTPTLPATVGPAPAGDGVLNSESDTPPAAEEAPGDQTAKNLEQARQAAAQLNLGKDEVWGVESLARDLAVFGLDFTAMKDDPSDLAQYIRDKSLELLAELDAAPPETDYETARRRITGASARLANGLQNAGGANAGGASVKIDGVSVSGGFIVSVGNVIVDPLVLDLAGDGLDLKSAEEGVDFDMDGDGQTARMGFIRGDDALLFLDTHGDGVVHDGRQLFGNTDGYANGFEKLRAHDDNGDGVIDENDPVWESLRVWVEKTEDGVCEAGETMSMAEAGIASINVGYEDVREDDGKGNLVGQTGAFQRADGSTGRAADVWFQELRREAERMP